MLPKIISISIASITSDAMPYKTAFVFSDTLRQHMEQSLLIGKYLSGYPILAVVSKRCIISEFKDRSESESGAPGSFITPRMSPLGVGP